MNTGQSSEKKSRGFGRLLGKRDKTPERPTALPDSAYASSETPSGEATNTDQSPDMVPAEKDSDIANIDKDKNLALKPSTGEVFDRDTGAVVTVVTTTTTTTTTTTNRPGQKEPQVNKDVQEQVQKTEHAIPDAPASGGATSSEPKTVHPEVSEMPANPANPNRSTSSAPVHSPGGHSDNSPPLPPRNNMRDQGRHQNPPTGQYNAADSPSPIDPSSNVPYSPNEAPVSPQRHNFSYPSRSNHGGVGPTVTGPGELPGPGITQTQHPQQHSKSTISDLRAAAKGIHGVGETLRGTLNSAVDQRFPSRNTEKAAAIQAKNEGVLARGRSEMEGIPAQHRQSGAYQDPNAMHNQPPPTGQYDTNPNQQQYVQEDVEQRERQKVSSIGKLFKRKPVAGDDGQGLRVTNP